MQPNVKQKEFDTQAAMHEHSLGRPGKKLHEVTLPVDFDALRFGDVDGGMHPATAGAKLPGNS